MASPGLLDSDVLLCQADLGHGRAGGDRSMRLTLRDRPTKKMLSGRYLFVLFLRFSFPFNHSCSRSHTHRPMLLLLGPDTEPINTNVKACQKALTSPT